MKKVISLLLALMLVFGLATTAFATATEGEGGAPIADDESILTIKTAANHTYKVYQLLIGDVSGLEENIEDIEGMGGTLSNIQRGSNLKTDKTIEAFLAAIKDKTGAVLANAALPFVDTTEAEYTVINNTKVDSDKQITVKDGYYFVVDTWTDANAEAAKDDALSRYMIAVVGDTTMKPKVAKPSIDKKIIDDKTDDGKDDPNKAIDTDKKVDTAAIGDTIEYEITGEVPNTEGYTYYYYVVHDTMSKGLTLNEGSFEVTVGGTPLTEGTHYRVYITKDEDKGTTTFELAFADMKALVDAKTIAVGADISIQYTAEVNDKAEIGTNPNTNTANLEYSNNPGSSARNDKEDKPGVPGNGTATGEGPDNETKTYVTELTIDKVDNKGMVLTGAEFTLTGTNLTKVIVKTATEFVEPAEGETANYYELTNGTFTLEPPIVDENKVGYNKDLYKSLTPTHVRKVTVTTSTAAAGDPKAIVGRVDASGRVTFTGLNAGEYTLTETKTPEGYNTIEDITFTITGTGDAKAFAWSVTGTDIVLDATNGVFNTVIENVPGTELPETGGIGTTLFYIIGGVLAAAAVVLLITKKRMASEY